MNDKQRERPLVQILVPIGRVHSVQELASELLAMEFFPIVQPIDAEVESRLGVIAGGGSPQAKAIVVDLDEASNARVQGIMKYCPELEGRFIIVGPPDEELAKRRVVFTGRQEIIHAVERLVKGMEMTEGSA